MKKKSEITTAVLFYILMAVVFTGILIFSLSQIDNLNKISKVKNIEEVKEEILDVITFCDDPLKKGSRKVFYIKANGFNEICFLGENLGNYEYIANKSKLETIYNTKTYIVILNSKQNSSNITYEYQILNTIDGREIPFEKTKCYYDRQKIKITSQC